MTANRRVVIRRSDRRAASLRRLGRDNSEATAEALRKEIARSERSRYDQRLHGVLMVTLGMDYEDVARCVGHTPRTVRRWVREFERRGFAGLRKEGNAGPRSRVLTPELLEKLELELRRQPNRLGYDETLWTGTLLSHHLRTRHGIDLKVRQCQRLFGMLGYQFDRTT